MTTRATSVGATIGITGRGWPVPTGPIGWLRVGPSPAAGHHRLTWKRYGWTATLQASSDLKEWTDLGNLIEEEGEGDLPDEDHPRRFYRLKLT